MFRTLNPKCVLNLVFLSLFYVIRNITIKLFLPMKVFDPSLKVLEYSLQGRDPYSQSSSHPWQLKNRMENLSSGRFKFDSTRKKTHVLNFLMSSLHSDHRKRFAVLFCNKQAIEYEQKEQLRVPLSLHGSLRGLGFHLYLDFTVSPDNHNYRHDVLQCVYWETGHVKKIQK